MIWRLVRYALITLISNLVADTNYELCELEQVTDLHVFVVAFSIEQFLGEDLVGTVGDIGEQARNPVQQNATDLVRRSVRLFLCLESVGQI